MKSFINGSLIGVHDVCASKKIKNEAKAKIWNSDQVTHLMLILLTSKNVFSKFIKNNSNLVKFV